MPCARSEVIVGADSHLFAVKRRWMDWSGRVVEEERYWFIIWPVGVVRSGWGGKGGRRKC